MELYINDLKIENGTLIDLDKVQAQPVIRFKREHGKQYTMLMIDPDAPSRKNPLYKYWIHWLVINDNETLMEFSPPMPPRGSGMHRYFICVFEQQGKISDSLNDRKNFDISKFKEKHGLKSVGSVMFRSERK